jgi:hypothetical protein
MTITKRQSTRTEQVPRKRKTTNTYVDKFESEVIDRLRRIETRMVNGFSGLGTEVMETDKGINVQFPSVAGQEGVITITSMGTSVREILDMLNGYRAVFKVIHNDRIICKLDTW